MSPPPPSILVLGAGELGMEMLKSLSHHPLLRSSSSSSQPPSTRIAVLLRPSTLSTNDPIKVSRNSLLRSWHIDLLPGDVESDPEPSLSQTFAEFHTIISCTGMYSPAGTQERIARAVFAAEVKRYFPWQFGLDYDSITRGSAGGLFDGQMDVRRMLRGQRGTKWVIVSTGLFTSFLFEPVFGLVDETRRKVMAIGGWDAEITVASPEDIGRLTAEVAVACPEIEGVVFTAGDTVTMRRLAEVVERVTGREVERGLKSVAELREELRGDPEDAMKKYRVVFAEGKGTAWSKERSFNGVRGIRTQTVDEWADANLR